MSAPAVRLIDILSPQHNPWLRDLSRRKADLPIGVRVVRFSDNDEEAGIEVSGAQKSVRETLPSLRKVAKSS